MKKSYKLNKDLISSIRKRIERSYSNNDIHSETGFLSTILEIVNDLFRKIGGRISSKKDIPAKDEYPTSSKHNKLINNITFDIEKLFNAQKLIEDDVNNVLSFNSVQRERIFEDLTSVQQLVYSAFVRSKQEIGGVEIPAISPFSSSDNISNESKGVIIDENREILTLAHTSSIKKPIDYMNTTIYFSGSKPAAPIYPNANTLAPASHWKRFNKDPHFVDITNNTILDNYKYMIIDDPNENTGIGICEFEAVNTKSLNIVPVTLRQKHRISGGAHSVSPSIRSVRSYLSEVLGKDVEDIYIDLANSLQGEFVKTESVASNDEQTPSYKIVMPFTEEVLTNEIKVEFSGNMEGYIPKIDWKKSKVFSDREGADKAYDLIPPTDRDSTDGTYSLKIDNFIVPTRVELIVYYDNDEQMWSLIDFFMSHYTYYDNKTYSLPFTDSEQSVALTLYKTYDIFVDAEANREREKQRALKVLKGLNGRGG